MFGMPMRDYSLSYLEGSDSGSRTDGRGRVGLDGEEGDE